jgi:tripartite-type tricarboxylate transporter receptor subunit TctC
MPRRRSQRLLAVILFSLVGISSASALDYPTRPVRWVVGYPAGGSTDIMARLVGSRLADRLGQQFVIENKPGG